MQKIERKLFCFARQSSAGGNAGARFQIIRAIFARKRFELRSANAIGGYRITVLPQVSNLLTGVRLPLPALRIKLR